MRDLFPHPYTIERAHEFLHRAISEQPEMKFCVEIAHAAVGGIGVHPGKDVYRHTATVGYWLGEQFWGRGVMTEALTAVTDFCFDNFPLRRIFPEVFANILHPHACWKSRIYLGRTSEEQRPQGRGASGFTSLRSNKVASHQRATCL